MARETTLEEYKDLLREGFSTYTRTAFQMLPKLDKPHILDIGCGSGIPTMELARLSNGKIIGLDINQHLLDRLKTKIDRAGLTDRMETMKCSMFNMPFPDESFDIIWSEGSIFIIGFKKGLKEWWRLLKPNGFLVVHDEVGDIKEKIEQIASHSYDLLGHFILGERTWWNGYYAPLEKRIREMRRKYADNTTAIAMLDMEQREIELVRQNPGRYCSVYLVMKKR